jgi:hypothetical protein
MILVQKEFVDRGEDVVEKAQPVVTSALPGTITLSSIHFADYSYE